MIEAFMITQSRKLEKRKHSTLQLCEYTTENWKTKKIYKTYIFSCALEIWLGINSNFKNQNDSESQELNSIITKQFNLYQFNIL